MATRYHFNKDTGRTGKCEAKIKCRLGLAESEHFATREEAQQAFEKTMSETSGTLKKGQGQATKNSLANRKFKSLKHSIPSLEKTLLEGKTLKEYRETIVELHEKNTVDQEEVKKELIEMLDLPGELDEYEVSFQGDSEKVYISTTHIPEYTEGDYDREGYFDVERGNYDDYDEVEAKRVAYDNADNEELYSNIDELVDEAYREKPEVDYDELDHEGYYDRYYDVPHALKDKVDQVLLKKHTDKLYDIAVDERFPDWAVLGSSVVLRERTVDLNHFKKDKFYGQHPAYPTAKVNKLRKTAFRDIEVQKLGEKKLRLAGKNLDASNQWKEIVAYENSNQKEDFDFKYVPSYKNATRADKKRIMNTVLDTKDKSEDDFHKVNDQIKALNALSEDEVKTAKEEMDKIVDAHEAKTREYRINQLSNYYPAETRSERVKHAEQWIDENPGILKIEGFDKIMRH